MCVCCEVVYPLTSYGDPMGKLAEQSVVPSRYDLILGSIRPVSFDDCSLLIKSMYSCTL